MGSRALSHRQAAGEDVEFVDGGRPAGADVPVDLRATGRELRAEALVGLDQHRVRRSRVPVDDPVLELSLDLLRILQQHQHVAAVRIGRDKATDAVDEAVATDEAPKAAQ